MNSGERARRRAGEQFGPVRWARARLALVFWLLVTFVLLGIAAHRTVAFELDVRFTRWVQGLDWRPLRWATDFTNWAMSGMPLTIGAIAVVVLLLLQGWRVDAVMLAVVIAIRLLNSGLKAVIESPRPTPDLVKVSEHSQTFGFPSGHASGALLVIGAIAWIITRRVASPAWRVAVWVIAACWISLTGFGRIYVGAHWPSDVLGGWLWSAAALVLIAWGIEVVRSRQVAHSEGRIGEWQTGRGGF